MRWEPLEDRYYYQLRYDKEVAKPSMLPAPTAMQSEVEADEGMKSSIDAIMRMAPVVFRSASTLSDAGPASEPGAGDQEEASSTGDAFSAYGLVVDSVLDTSSVKRDHECIACVVEGRRIPADCAFQTCQSHQRAAVVGRGNTSAEFDPRMMGRPVMYDATTDYDVVLKRRSLEELASRSLRRNIKPIRDERAWDKIGGQCQGQRLAGAPDPRGQTAGPDLRLLR